MGVHGRGCEWVWVRVGVGVDGCVYGWGKRVDLWQRRESLVVALHLGERDVVRDVVLVLLLDLWVWGSIMVGWRDCPRTSALSVVVAWWWDDEAGSEPCFCLICCHDGPHARSGAVGQVWRGGEPGSNPRGSDRVWWGAEGHKRPQTHPTSTHALYARRESGRCKPRPYPASGSSATHPCPTDPVAE